MKRHSMVFAAAVLVAAPAHAATPVSPGAVLEGSRDTREYLESQRRRAAPVAPGGPAIIDQTIPAQPAPKGGETRFVLTELAFTPSRVLSAEALRQVAADYVGREVAIDDLFAVVERINALYREQGVIAAKAVLPPQRIAGGRVQVRLVEGEVGTVSISGNADTRAEFVTRGIRGLEPGNVVRLEGLESELFFFSSVNDIDLRAVLKPGQAFGTTDYELQVIEPRRFENTVFIDNAGRDDVGLYRLGFSHVNRSLFGYRDDLSLGGHIAEGTRALYGAYNFPLNSRGTRLGVSVDYSAIDIVDGALEPLDVTGESVNAGLFLTRPIVVQRDRVVNGFAGYSFKESSTDFDGVTLFETSVRSVTVGVDVQRNGFDSSWFARLNATGAPDTWGNTKSFFRVNADYSRMTLLQDSQVLLLRARAQWSPDDLLPSSEQFQIGGMSSVRGYPEGLLIGDKGYFVSLELSFPVSATAAADLSVSPFAQRWRGILFLDHGGAFPFKGNNESIDEDDFLTSLGGGFSLNLGRQTQARLVVGFPVGSRDDGEDSPTLHFFLQSHPFD